MKRILLPALLILALTLSACSAATTPPAPLDGPSSNDAAARMDQQGAIIFQVTPLNMNAPTDTLEFDITLTTHTIDLSMDLAELSTLTTDTGVSVNASLWDAPCGGHHVEGKLFFPSMQDNKSILEGAKKLTLTIRNVDAPTRIFEWELK